MRKTLLLAAALIAAPAIAQDNNVAATADTNATNVAVPDANAVDPLNMDANAVAPLPPVTTEPVATDTAATPAPSDDDDGFPWGIIGLVGLVGLLGRSRS